MHSTPHVIGTEPLEFAKNVVQGFVHYKPDSALLNTLIISPHSE